MSSGWFDCTEPSLTTSLQGKQGVQGAYALVRGGSSMEVFQGFVFSLSSHCVQPATLQLRPHPPI